MKHRKFKKAIIWIGHNVDPIALSPKKADGDFLIGVDRGALRLAEAGRKMDLAIGDFDSVSEEELERVKTAADKTIILPQRKDESDTEAAYRFIKDGAESIEIYGGISGPRIEHFLAVLTILMRDDRVTLIDSNSKIYFKKHRQKPYELDNKDAYYSFYATRDSLICLEGFSYCLNDYPLKPDDPLCLSNELVSPKGLLTIKKGGILVIETKKDVNSCFVSGKR